MIGCDWTSTLMCFSRILRHELNEIECLFFYIYSMKHMVIFLSCITLWPKLADFVQKSMSFFSFQKTNEWFDNQMEAYLGLRLIKASLCVLMSWNWVMFYGFSKHNGHISFWTISKRNDHCALKMGLATRVRKIPIAQSDQTSFGFTTRGLVIRCLCFGGGLFIDLFKDWL